MNAAGFPVLSTAIWLPTAGALLIWLLARGRHATTIARWLALVVSVVVFLITLILWARFDPTTAAMQFVERHAWIPSLHIEYYLGVDGISMPFVLLSALLTIICVVSAWGSVQERVPGYMIAFLVLETTLIGVFSALDAILFYFFWEAMLIPMYLIIGIWGGPNRVYATIKFFLYTLAGSVLLLVALLVMHFQLPERSFAIPDLMAGVYPFEMQLWLWLAMFVAFAVKIPMWPVHTWLPDAHTEAPTAGSVMLAGILLKMGAYGFLRFSIPMLPDASRFFAPMVIVLSIVAVVYIALVAMMQKDLKRLIAYSSIAHMGFVTLGSFVFTQQALEGAIITMISHGFVSAALFLCVGVLYDRMHTREIAAFGGVANVMPVFATIAVFFAMANVALPGTSSFIGEILVLLGTFWSDPNVIRMSAKWVAVLAALSVILSACYTLWMVKRVIFGDVKNERVRALTEMNWREFAFFMPLVLLVLWVGLYPKPLLEVIHASAAHLLDQAVAVKATASVAWR
ncbi:MAG: NADH-quinone oxidoreductase subunit M [Zetaproteobacteria bacterium]|nr:MAG: NADH-quinone oxidoreductase subunit M [Zetaproteobacteria bacterium]